MKVTIKKETEKTLEFELQESTVSFANMVRRIAIGQVPVYAIKSVVVYENRSTMFDEYLANRLGLIPLTTPQKVKEEEVLFSLDATGPCTVYSKDMKNYDDSVKVANTKIPILKLDEGQSIRVECKASAGTGREHSRHQPGLVAYNQVSEGEFAFKVETFAQMPAREMMARAAQIANDKCNQLLELVVEAGKKD
ncbi:DNA-directed RNA polymerase subunit D [Candidatus Parvarchaeota archaeon]|nr:DNA-directed RNA polymerase subunit D [Candidatus Parvarchaeota archaeon]